MTIMAQCKESLRPLQTDCLHYILKMGLPPLARPHTISVYSLKAATVLINNRLSPVLIKRYHQS